MRRKLKPKQEAFCREYVVDYNGARAAIAAGYSQIAAKEAAAELLTYPHVRSRVDELMAQRLKKADVNAERVLQRLANLAFFDSRRFYHEDGRLKNPSELDDETADAISSFDVKELFVDGDGKGAVGQVMRYRLLDRGQNLERLGRVFALFTDKLQVEVAEGLAAAIADGRKRAIQTEK